jgi:hypothetical protein
LAVAVNHHAIGAWTEVGEAVTRDTGRPTEGGAMCPPTIPATVPCPWRTIRPALWQTVTNRGAVISSSLPERGPGQKRTIRLKMEPPRRFAGAPSQNHGGWCPSGEFPYMAADRRRQRPWIACVRRYCQFDGFGLLGLGARRAEGQAARLASNPALRAFGLAIMFCSCHTVGAPPRKRTPIRLCRRQTSAHSIKPSELIANQNTDNSPIRVSSACNFAPWGVISRTVAEYLALCVITSAAHKTPIRRHEKSGRAWRRC